MENKTIEELTADLSKRLSDAGLLANGDQSIFSQDLLVEVRGDGIMLVGPHHEAWVWFHVSMTDKQLDDEFKKFLDLVIPRSKEALNNRIEMNANISVSEFIGSVAKILGGKAPTKGLANTSLVELVKQIAPENTDSKK